MKTIIALMLSLSFTMAFAADKAPSAADVLRGTEWQGTFHFHKWTGKLSMKIRPELSAAGDLQYDFAGTFDGFPTPVRQLLTKFDVGCPTAPRQLKLVPVAGAERSFTGTITTVLHCPETAEQAAGERTASVHVVQFEFSEDYQRTRAAVTDPSGLIRIEYDLTRSQP